MLPPRLCAKSEIRQGVPEFGSGHQGGGPSRPRPVQGGLKGEDSAQSSADPSGDGDGPGDLFHENGACLVQGLLEGNAVTVSRERRLFQTGTEERRQEEPSRLGYAASIEPIDPFKVRVE